MGDLSKHFSRHEFACECGCGFDTPEQNFLIALEDLRIIWGHPIIQSYGGCRCKEHNDSIEGSSPTSKHVDGEAIDIKCKSDNIQYAHLFECALNIKEFHDGGIGLYDWGIHVDARTTGQARWDRRTKK